LSFNFFRQLNVVSFFLFRVMSSILFFINYTTFYFLTETKLDEEQQQSHPINKKH